jgi:hypothetical protein
LILTTPLCCDMREPLVVTETREGSRSSQELNPSLNRPVRDACKMILSIDSSKNFAIGSLIGIYDYEVRKLHIPDAVRTGQK